MIPGAKKEAALSAFLTEAVTKSLDVCCEEIHNSLADIYEDVEMEVIGQCPRHRLRIQFLFVLLAQII